MSKYSETVELRGGAEVVLNVGLDGPTYGRLNRLCPYERALMVRKALREVMEPGVVYNRRDDTLIVTGQFRSNVGSNMLLWDALKLIEQDCCAIYYKDSQVGVLYGEHAEQWGVFDINHFTFTEEAHA